MFQQLIVLAILPTTAALSLLITMQLPKAKLQPQAQQHQTQILDASVLGKTSVAQTGAESAESQSTSSQSTSLWATSSQGQLQNSPKAILDQAWQIINQDFVDPQFNQVNWQSVRQQLLSQNYTSREAAYTALKQAIEQLNDPYTRFIEPREFQQLTSETVEGELTGVGLQLRQQEQALQVQQVFPGSPAQQAGVRAGDQILQINGQTTQGLAIEKAATLIRGPAGSTVNLVVRSAGQQPTPVTLTRRRVEVPVVYSSLRQEGKQRVGYIRLSDFSGHAAQQMQQAITQLKQQGVERFVLDLRGNPGGRLDQATEIAQMWLSRAPLVRMVGRDDATLEIQATGTALTNLPLTVLIDGGSASASEILAGALRDNRRALLVGTQTYGKALVQVVNPLSDGSGLNVTIAKYFTPSGVDINHRGITPDVQVALTREQLLELSSNPEKLGTAQDPQYQQAIAVQNRLPANLSLFQSGKYGK